MKIPEELKWYLKAVALLAMAMSVLLMLPLLIGIWLPDVIGAPRNILAEERAETGETVRVIQYWNRIDFYSTELEYIGTNGVVDGFTLDGDDSKSWSVPLVVDWKTKTAQVTLGGERVKTVSWSPGSPR